MGNYSFLNRFSSKNIFFRIKISKYNPLRKISTFQIIILGFLCVILMGTILLTFPVSSSTGKCTGFLDSLFTATSAVCVTGLVVRDTATHWSIFGQMVILILIQIGGLGVISTASCISILTKRRIGLRQRNLMQEAISADYLGGIVRLTAFSIQFTICIEAFGAFLLFMAFGPVYGLRKGLWYAIFHSVSAFCNAGFDLMGTTEPFSSLTGFQDNIIINVTIMALIVTGGLGFLTWEDIRKHKFHIKKYRMQTKVIIAVSGGLILIPAIYFYFGEFAAYPGLTRLLGSFFQSVTLRTAGFNTLNLASCSETGWLLMILLMLIGGSPGSTAGGMKTTTIAVLFANVKAVFGRKEDITLFKRRIPDDMIHQASVILFLYLTLFLGSGMIISKIEGLPVMECLFETASAIGTVGLTLGITTQIGNISHIILIGLMFFGRAGGLTIIYAASMGVKKTHSRLPLDKITVG